MVFVFAFVFPGLLTYDRVPKVDFEAIAATNAALLANAARVMAGQL